MIISNLEMDTYRQWIKENQWVRDISDMTGVEKYDMAKVSLRYAMIRFNICCGRFIDTITPLWPL